MPTDRETPRDEEKAEAMDYRLMRLKQTDARLKEEITLTGKVGSDEFALRERRESHIQSIERTEIGGLEVDVAPASTSADAESPLSPSVPDLLPRPNTRRLTDGSARDAADEEPDSTR